MELETQVQVSGNQLKRQDEDKKDLREQLEAVEQKEREMAAKLREQRYKYADLESKVGTRHEIRNLVTRYDISFPLF